MIGRPALLGMGLCLLTQLAAQTADYRPSRRAKWLYEEARTAFGRYQHERAEALLDKLFSFDTIYPAANQLAAELAVRMQRDSMAAAYYQRIVRHFPQQYEAWYNLGQTAYNAGMYATAAAAWDSFLVHVPPGGRFRKYRQWAQEKIAMARFADSLRRHPLPVQLHNLGPAVNTVHDEYWPVLTGDEQHLYFTRRIPVDTFEMRRTGQRIQRRSQEDIFWSQRSDTGWTTAQPVPGQLNTAYNEGAITMAPDGRYIIFTGCNWPDGYGSCDLYYSQRRNGRWTRPRNLGPPINTVHKETQPSLSADGRELFFSSSRPGGRGGLDIWVSRRGPDGRWQPPVPLDSPVNTPANEQAPFIHYDGVTLYFASRGHAGLGRSDLYRAVRGPDGRFGEVRNLGYPINSHRDEISLYVSPTTRTAYIASEAGGYGGLDIYSFKMPEAVAPGRALYVKGQVIDARTRVPIPQARLEFYRLPDGRSTTVLRTDEAGRFLTTLPAGSDYGIHVSAGPHYLLRSIHLPLRDYQKARPYERTIPLTPIQQGAAFDLHNVFFDFDSDRLKPASRRELQRVIQWLRRHPHIRIRIIGHTDDKGSHAYNQALSLRRARAVRRYLIEQGHIAPDRIDVKGMGETAPVATNTTEAGRAQNRRIEIRIIAIKK